MDWSLTAQWIDDTSSSSSASEWLQVDRHTTVDRQDSDSEEFEFVLLSEPRPLAQSAIPNPSTAQSPPERSQTVSSCIAREADSVAQLPEAADPNQQLGPAEQRKLSRQISEQCSTGPESIAQLMTVSETSVFACAERAQMAEVLEEARHDARRAKSKQVKEVLWNEEECEIILIPMD